MSAAPLARPFDRAASGYDDHFTDRLLGRWLRDAVRERIATCFGPGQHVLELGCGTGEDAVWLAGRGVRVTATDSSAAMLAEADRKARAFGVAEAITFAWFDFADDSPGAGPEGEGWRSPATPCGDAEVDGVLANFGALNCVPDRRRLAARLAAWTRPGARLALVLMGPLCAWEVAWHLAHGQPCRAFRRLRPGQAAHVGGGDTTRVWYPSPRTLRRELGPWFRHLETTGIGLLLPPSYLSHLVERWPRRFAGMRALEHWLAPRFPSAWLSDHYLVIFERR